MDTRNINDYGEVINTTQDVIEALYVNPDLDLSLLRIDDTDELQKYNMAKSTLYDDVDELSYVETTLLLSTFDLNNKQKWFIPENYMEIDLRARFHLLCSGENDTARVDEELALFEERGLTMVLRYMIYLVDVMRENNVVWGVGRGSSVASFCLYLIGINKINPMKYDLDIKEFLR